MPSLRAFPPDCSRADGGGSKEPALHPRGETDHAAAILPEVHQRRRQAADAQPDRKLMALPPLLLTPEGIQAAVHGAPRDRGEAVSVQTLFGKIALDSVKIAHSRNVVILPDLQLLFQKKSIDQGVVLSGKAALRFGQRDGNRASGGGPVSRFLPQCGGSYQAGSSSRSPSMTAPNAKCAPLSGNSRCEASPSPMMLEAAAPACALCALMSLICATKPSA